MNNKTISDLSSISLNELNDSCNFVLDDANKKTKKVSFENLKNAIISGSGNADIIYMSPEEYELSAKSGLLDEEKYYATSADAGGYSFETWTFVLEDGTSVTKNVYISAE